MTKKATNQTSTGRLIRRRDVGGGLVLHELDPGLDAARTYERPGQYFSVGLGGKSTYFVLAGEPGLPTWEALVRPVGDVADALLALPPEGAVRVSSALGLGFPLEQAESRRLFVLAAGSGVAAIRPVLTSRVRAGLAARTEVFLGVRSKAELPLADEIAVRRAQGVTVTVCFSREAADEEGTASGYVQAVFLQRRGGDGTAQEGAMVFAAGGSEMVAEVRKVASELGLPEADVHTNY